MKKIVKFNKFCKKDLVIGDKVQFIAQYPGSPKKRIMGVGTVIIDNQGLFRVNRNKEKWYYIFERKDLPMELIHSQLDCFDIFSSEVISKVKEL